jgi:hypothetical protein
VPAAAPPAGASPPERATGIPVRLHPTASVPAPVLATHLGPGFDVQVADTCSEGIFVVPGSAFARGARQWVGQPQTAVLVLVAGDTPSREIARVLDQGADGCLATSNPPLVASQVLALARRVLHRSP